MQDLKALLRSELAKMTPDEAVSFAFELKQLAKEAKRAARAKHAGQQQPQLFPPPHGQQN